MAVDTADIAADAAEVSLAELKTLGSRKRIARARFYLFVAVTDLSSIAVAMLIAALVRFDVPDAEMLFSLFGFLATVYLSIAIWGGAYDLEMLASRRRFVGKGGRALLVSFIAISLVFFSFKIGAEYSRLLMALLAVVAAPVLGLARYLAWPHLNAILAGQAFSELVIVDGVEAPSSAGSVTITAQHARILPDMSTIENVDRLSNIAAAVDRIVVYCSPERRQAWADLLRCLSIRCEIRVPELDCLRPLSVYTRDGVTTAVVSEHSLEWHQAATKRVFDLTVTMLAMPMLLPVMVIVALAVKLDSAGPILFRQQRFGLSNRTFMMMKFRTMRIDMQDDQANRLTQRRDSRVTRVGRFLRKTSLDELPQFFNVLAGDMSIVGPRPHAPMALAGTRLYWEVDQSYWRRHVAKPGITGLAQVRGFRGNTFEESDLQSRLDADLEYVAEWSLWRDIEILVATLRVLKHDKAF